MAGEWMFLTPEYILQDMPIDFFDFQFIMNADGSMKECKYWEQTLDPAIWQSLFIIRDKYNKKNEKMKRNRDGYNKQVEVFQYKKAEYNRQKQQRAEKEKHLQDHIRRGEAKLTEYKNTILAFWKLAACNWISK